MTICEEMESEAMELMVEYFVYRIVIIAGRKTRIKLRVFRALASIVGEPPASVLVESDGRVVSHLRGRRSVLMEHAA